MSAAIRAQLIGIRTLRSTYGTVVALLALAVLITGGELATNAGTAYTTPGELREPLLVSGLLTAVGMALFAATRAAGEWRHGMISQRLLATPHKERLVVAMFVGYAALALIVGAAAMAASLAVALPILAAKGLDLGLTVGMVAASLLAVALLAVIGSGVGVICRSQPTAVLVVGGSFVAERLLSSFLGDLGLYLPYALVTQMLGLEGSILSPVAASLGLVSLTAAVGVLSAFLITRRDVSSPS